MTSNRPRHVTCHIQQLPQVGVGSTTWRQALLGVVCTAVLWKPRTGMRIARMCQIVQRDYTRFLLASSPCPSEHLPHMLLQWITGWLRPWHDRNDMGELCLPTPAESSCTGTSTTGHIERICIVCRIPRHTPNLTDARDNPPALSPGTVKSTALPCQLLCPAWSRSTLSLPPYFATPASFPPRTHSHGLGS